MSSLSSSNATPKRTPSIIHPSKKSHRQKSPEDTKVQHFLRATLAPHKKRLMVAWGLDVLSALLLVVLAWQLSGVFADLLVWQAQGILAGQAGDLVLSALPVLGGCLFGRLCLMSVRESLLSSVGVAMAGKVRRTALQAVGALTLARRQFGADGAIASHLLREPDELLGYARFYVQKLTAVSTPLIVAGIIASQSVRSALILLATAPFVVICMALIGIKTAKKSREQMDALAQMGGRFLDWLRGMNTLVRLGAVGVASQDVAWASHEYKKRTMSVLGIAFLNSTVLEFFAAISIALVAVYLGFGLMGLLPWSYGQAIIDYHSALFILLLVPEFYSPLRRLGAEYHAKSSAFAAAKVLAPMSEQKQVGNKPPLMPADMTLSLCDVSVVVDGRVRLPTCSLVVQAGQKWAVMGKSGSGKSTLFEVLLGVCDYEGSVKIGGLEIRDGDMQALHSKIGYLPQTPALLPMSIADNLRLVKAHASHEELVAVLEKVGLSALMALPNGLDTVLSERGGGLSGGQGQRLAIAQLLLWDADLWLLDEPTEHLDKQTKDDIHALLCDCAKGKTVLWATHDTPVSWLDGVYHLDNDQTKPQKTLPKSNVAKGDGHDDAC